FCYDLSGHARRFTDRSFLRGVVMPFEFQPKPAPSQHEQFEVESEGLGRYTIDVSLPVGHEQTGAKLPVILVTDGNLLFDIVQTQVHGRFSRMGTLLPPSVVVGVGYPADEGNASFYARRNFDFH